MAWERSSHIRIGNTLPSSVLLAWTLILMSPRSALVSFTLVSFTRPWCRGDEITIAVSFAFPCWCEEIMKALRIPVNMISLEQIGAHKEGSQRRRFIQ
jgi:hypothetical protein